VGVCDLDVIAKALVEADLERADAGAGNFLGLKAGDPILPTLGDSAQLIKGGVMAGPNQTTFFRAQRRLIGQGSVESGPDAGAELEIGLQLREQRRTAGSELGLELGQKAQGVSDGTEVARRDAARAEPSSQALQIRDGTERFAQAGACGRFAGQFVDGVEP